MGSFKPHTFDPLELESSIWALGATDCPKPKSQYEQGWQSALRKRISRGLCPPLLQESRLNTAEQDPSKPWDSSISLYPVRLPNTFLGHVRPSASVSRMRMVPNWLVVMLRLNVSA